MEKTSLEILSIALPELTLLINTTVANLICDQIVSKQQFVVKLEGRSLNWPLQSKNASDKVSVLCSLKVKAVISSQEDKTNYGLISSGVSTEPFRINIIYV